MEPVSPHINYLDPPAGVIGSMVMINGKGFDPIPSYNTVLFNGTKAEVKRSSLSSLERLKVLAEPAAASTYAALMSGKIRIPSGSKVVCVLSGGNIDRERLRSLTT